MNRHASSRNTLVLALIAFAAILLFAIPSAHAELAVTFTPEGTVTAYPDGADGVVPVKVTWTCEEFASASGDITLAVTVDANSTGEGSATLDNTTITPDQVIVECTPGETVDAVASVTVKATGGSAGDTIEITVTATPPAGAGGDAADPVTADYSVTVGAKVDVQFTANNTAFQLYPGQSQEESIMIVSNSNDDVMAMPAVISWPEDWSEASVGPVTLEGPAAEGSLDFTVTVPSNAVPGDYELVFSMYAHSLLDASVATDPVELAYTVTVPDGPAPAMDGEEGTEDSPALPALVPVSILVALLVALRRRH